MTPQVVRRLMDLADADSFVHGVQNALRARFGSHPDLFTTASPQCMDRVTGHQVAPRLHLERNSSVQRVNGIGKFLSPSR